MTTNSSLQQASPPARPTATVAAAITLATQSKSLPSQASIMGTIRPKSRPLVGNFEENILNNRLQPDRVVDDYSLEVRSVPWCNRSLKSKVRVSFFSAGDCFPYLGQAHIGQRAFKIPRKGSLQVTLFNPNGTLVKLFLLQYDLTDMPPNSQTFLRQRTLLLVRNTSDCHSDIKLRHRPEQTSCFDALTARIQLPTTKGAQVPRDNKLNYKNPPPSNIGTNLSTGASTANPSGTTKRRIKYMIHLNIVSSKSGRLYLNKDLRIFISKKVDLDTATQFSKQDYELKSIDEVPSIPGYFSR